MWEKDSWAVHRVVKRAQQTRPPMKTNEQGGVSQAHDEERDVGGHLR